MLGVLSGLQGWHGLQYCNAMEYGRATMQAGLVEQVTSVTHVQAAHLSLRETLRGSTKGAAFDGCAASSWLALSPQGLLSLAGLPYRLPFSHAHVPLGLPVAAYASRLVP